MLLPIILILTCSLQTATGLEGFIRNGENGIRVNFPLNEELPVGTLIGSLAEKLNFRTPSSSGKVQFTPLGQERYIRLNQSSGQLFVRSRIDREALCEQTGTCCAASSKMASSLPHAYEPDDMNTECELKLLVIDQRIPYSSKQPQLIHITFDILDINDNPPRWSPDNLEIEIPEHSPIGTLIQLPAATDPDQGVENAAIRYELMPQVDGSDDFSHYESRSFGELFTLSITPTDRLYGRMQQFHLQLKVNADLDRERRDSYRLLLIAIDGDDKVDAFGERTGTLNIIIKVTDINDQAPFFPEEHPFIEVSEDVAPGTRIYTMVAKDNDPSDVSRLIYRFASTASGEAMRLFRICEKSGAITVAQNLDYETAPLLSEVRPPSPMFSPRPVTERDVGYIIPVRVTDGVHSSQADLRVRLKNVNDNAPNVTLQSHLPRWRNTKDFLLPEDVAVGTMIATITMEDADERWLDHESLSEYNKVHCVTAHPFFAVQTLFPNAHYQYMLVTSRRLDRETKSSHTVTITCHDSGRPTLSRVVHTVIHLEDINDSPPVFSQPLYQSKISENLPVKTLIDKVQATDADAGLNGAVRYVLKADVGVGHLVNLDPLSGQFYTAAIYDREKLESINFTVLAVDCAGGVINESTSGEACGPVHSATATVIITIEDVNDCVPQFNQSNYEFVVKEGQRSQQAVGTVHATDNDADARNSRIQYSISEPEYLQYQHSAEVNHNVYRDSSLFAVTSSGEIYTRNVPIDREKTPILGFTVVASDHGHPPLSAFANVLIRVQDVNDHTPVWVFPQSSNNIVVQVNISSRATVGQEIAHLKAIDSDSGQNGEIEYSIIKGNEYDYFALDKALGTLYLAKSLLSGAEPTSAATNGSDSTGQPPSKEPAPQSFILALKASDKGKTPRSNTTILKIDIVHGERPDGPLSAFNKFTRLGRHMSNSPQRLGIGAIGDRDLMIISAMIVVALVISFILIAAILFLRCHQSTRRGQGTSDFGNNVAGRHPKRFEMLNCLNVMDSTAEKKNRLTAAAFLLTDAERNPNFEERAQTQQYSTNRGTLKASASSECLASLIAGPSASNGRTDYGLLHCNPQPCFTTAHGQFTSEGMCSDQEKPIKLQPTNPLVHEELQMQTREGDIYSGFTSTVLLASPTLPGGRKGPIVATAGEDSPVGYMVTSNPALIDSNFVAYDTSSQKRHPGCDDSSTSTTDNAKNTYNSLLYRLPDVNSASVEKNYMTINPELFQQSIYRNLHLHEEWKKSANNANYARENDHGITKKVVILPQETPPTLGGIRDSSPLTSPNGDNVKPKILCRFTEVQGAAEVNLYSQPPDVRRALRKVADTSRPPKGMEVPSPEH